MMALARAARSLGRTPGPTLAAIVALALGIGAATAIFSVADAVMLRPLPYADAGRLVAIEGQFLALGMRDLGASPPELADYRARARSFDAIAAFSRSDVNLTGGGEAERISAVRVTPDLLPLLGARPALGRTFSDAEGQWGAETAAVLSHGLWQRRFGGDPSVLGQAIDLDGRAHIVVGVMPAGFRFPPPGARFGGTADVFVPLAFSKEDATARSQYSLAVVARLRPGVHASAATAEMAEIARALESEHPESYRGPGNKDGGWRVTVAALQDAVVGGAGPGVAVLFGAVLTLLLIACVDVAHVLLARGLARRRAVAVRMALGASRARLVREVLLESLVVALVGGALGALLAVWAIDLVVASGADIPRLAEASVDTRALFFAVGAAILSAVLGGVGPAWQVTRGNVTDALGEGGRSASPGRAGVRARRLLVVSELALAVLLVAGAGLFVRSLQRLHAVAPGFTKESVLTAAVKPTGRDEDPARRLALFERIRAGVAARPGVRTAALASRMPLTGPGLGGPFSVEGRPFDPNSAIPTFAVYRAVSPEYHAAMRVPILRGRSLSAADAPGAPAVAVINETLGRAFFGGGDPIGQRIKLGAPGSPRPWRTVVGITADVRDRALALPASPEIAVPLAQDPPSSIVIVARTAGDPIRLVPELQAVVRAADPSLPITDVRTLDRIVADSVAGRRSPALLLAGFALLAVILAGLGTYGVMSYAVSGRAHEMGVRMALGARPGDVARIVLGEGVLLACAGAVLGLGGAAMAGRGLSALLFEVRPADPLTFTAAAAASVAVAVAACARPALRAARVDPGVALREE
jgi:putative ABC transport system permease protein